ncbi:hypothetical protein ACHAXM_008131 [Skeletonema potamos]|jgi:ESCRT-I complex subunit VPS28
MDRDNDHKSINLSLLCYFQEQIRTKTSASQKEILIKPPPAVANRFNKQQQRNNIRSQQTKNMSSRWPTALDKSLSAIDLYESSKERKHYENCADLYTIITATEHLERAYAQDAISSEEYTTECNKLISQFKIAEKAALGKDKMTTEAFMKIYQMDCPRAAERLLHMGVPEPLRTADNSTNVAVSVAETVQHFITTMDNVKLERLDVDELQPLLSELMNALVQLPDVPNDWPPNHKVKKWLVKLNSMRAYERIDEDDGRQLYHDLDSAYLEFTQYLKNKR